MLCRHSGG
uniref:Uncharacterized protein n=1 Tax=Anguilla anguilla TaxID=7936 RepID=A0A0E9T7K0_ANGAN